MRNTKYGDIYQPLIKKGYIILGKTAATESRYVAIMPIYSRNHTVVEIQMESFLAQKGNM